MAGETTHVNTIKTGEIGEVKIADDVVAIIAGLAAADVRGVASLAGNATREVIGKLGIKGIGKGIRLTVEEGEVHVWLKVNVRYGFSIPLTRNASRSSLRVVRGASRLAHPMNSQKSSGE